MIPMQARRTRRKCKKSIHSSHLVLMLERHEKARTKDIISSPNPTPNPKFEYEIPCNHSPHVARLHTQTRTRYPKSRDAAGTLEKSRPSTGCLLSVPRTGPGSWQEARGRREGGMEESKSSILSCPVPRAPQTLLPALHRYGVDIEVLDSLMHTHFMHLSVSHVVLNRKIARTADTRHIIHCSGADNQFIKRSVWLAGWLSVCQSVTLSVLPSARQPARLDGRQ